MIRGITTLGIIVPIGITAIVRGTGVGVGVCLIMRIITIIIMTGGGRLRRTIVHTGHTRAEAGGCMPTMATVDM